MNRALSSLQGGSLEITLTVPLKGVVKKFAIMFFNVGIMAGAGLKLD